MKWDGYFRDDTVKQGRKYFEQGVVRNIRVSGNKAEADLIFKTKKQRVEITVSRNVLESTTCSCGKEKCSHITAFLAALDETHPDFLPDFSEPYFVIYERKDYSTNSRYVEIDKYSGSDETVVVPDGVVRLGKNLFSDHTEIKKIILPDTVRSIGDYAFCNCTGLEEINLSREIADIGDYAFDNCYLLADDNGLIEVNGRLFRNDRNRTGDLHIPEGVVSIAPQAFMDNEFDTITISSTVTDIGYYAFAGSAKVKEIVVPNSVKKMGVLVFRDCMSLETVRLPDGLDCLDSTFSGCTSLRNTVIPDTVKMIKGAFRGCSALTEIELPESVEKISFFGFSDCTNLEKITIKGKNIEIEDGSFDRCEKLQIFCNKSVARKIPGKYKHLLANYKKEDSVKDIPGYVDFYGKIDDIRVDDLLKDLTGCTDPKAFEVLEDCKLKTNIGGKEMKISYKVGSDSYLFHAGGWKAEYIDFNVARDNMMTREETENRAWEYNDCCDPADIYAAVRPDVPIVDEDVAERRYKLLLALGCLFAKEENLIKIAQAAPKKKDGTFNRARRYRLASTGLIRRDFVDDDPDRKISTCEILEIYAKPKSDTSLVIYADCINDIEKEFKPLEESFVSLHFSELGLDRYL